MNRLVMLRRFGPLAVVIVVQLLIVAAFPSKQAQQVEVAGGSGAISGTPLIPGFDPGDPTATTIAGDDGDVDPVTGAPRNSTRTTRPGGGDGGDPRRPGGRSTVPGDTSHCVNGRQFGTDVYAHPPPCVPVFGGDNGANTYTGVDDDSIKVVVYRGNLGAAVDAILTAQGSNPSDADFTAFMNEAFAWISDHYELYGRRIEPVLVRGQCPSVPPDYACLRNEARQIIGQHKPFAFIWNTSLASAFFDEFSANKVINIGGWGFRDQFSQLRRPYHYDIQMGGSQLVDIVSEWYCKRMHGGGTAKAEHAGDPDIRSRNRVLGAISTDDPENKKTIEELDALLKQKCGAQVSHTYFYAQDITTAEQQKRAAVGKMKEAPESTTVMCFCDLVAPTFLYQESQEQEYFPEHVLVATGFMDADGSAQAYDSLPSRHRRQDHANGYNFDYTFGLAQLPMEEPLVSNHAARIWQARGKSEAPYPSSYRDFEYYAFLGALLQGAGPALTPANVEAGAGQMLSSAPAGLANPAVNARGVNPTADYTWWDSVREVYWSATTRSQAVRNPDEGTGAWLPLGDGRWYRKGEIPTGLIKVPPVVDPSTGRREGA